MRVLFVLAVVGGAKDSKRIKWFLDAGFEVTAACFERTYPVTREAGVEVSSLGAVRNGHYFSRLIVYSRAIRKLRKLCRSCDLIVAMSPDLAAFAYGAALGLGKPMVLDVADIRKIQVSQGMIGMLWRSVERFIVPRMSLVFVTSWNFVTTYYRDRLKVLGGNFVEFENKVDFPISARPKPTPSQAGKVRIGYFGLIRSTWSLDVLVDLLRRDGSEYEVIVAGINLQTKHDLNELSKTLPGFNYLGPYSSFDELAALYSKIDVSFGFYPDPDPNPEWLRAQEICRSNRYYEALYFRTPLISNRDSVDGYHVRKYGLGPVIGSGAPHATSEALACVSHQDLKVYRSAIDAIPSEMFAMTAFQTELKERLLRICAKAGVA